MPSGVSDTFQPPTPTRAPAHDSLLTEDWRLVTGN
jgi:hypothetical protein